MMFKRVLYKNDRVTLSTSGFREQFEIYNEDTASSLLFTPNSAVELRRFLKDYFFGGVERGTLRFFRNASEFNKFSRDLQKAYEHLVIKHNVRSNFIMKDETNKTIDALDFFIKKYGLSSSHCYDEIIDTVEKIKSIKKLINKEEK